MGLFFGAQKMAIEDTASNIVQEVIDFRVDMQDFRDFLFDPADVMVTRRLAPDTHSLTHYLEYLDAIKLVFTQETGSVTVGDKTIKTVSQSIADAVDIIVKAGGHVGYATLAAATADKANITAKTVVEITNDTAVNNGIYLYDGSTFTKSPNDILTQAKTYTDTAKAAAISTAATDATTKANTAQANAKTYSDANKLDYAQITTAYKGGNLIGAKSKRVDRYWVDNLGVYATKAGTEALIIPVKAGDKLYILNTAGDYGTNKGFGLFTTDPSIDTGSVRIVGTRKTLVDTATSLTYIELTVPATANFLVLTSKYVDPIIWAVHKNSFSSSYVANEVIDTVRGYAVEYQQITPAPAVVLGTYVSGDLYRSTGVMQGHYLNSQGALFTTTNDWQVFRFSVTAGATYYIKIVGSQGTPFEIFYSDNINAVKADFVSQGEVPLIATSKADVFKFTVPTGSSAVYVNTKVQSLDLTPTISVQKDEFLESLIGVNNDGVNTINDKKIVDTYARSNLLTNNADISNLKLVNTRLTGQKIYAFGDSITQGTEGGYTQYIEQATRGTIVNYAMSGSSERRVLDKVVSGLGMAKRDSATAATVWPVIDFTLTNTVFIMIGTNVLAHPLGVRWGTLASIPLGSVYAATTPLAYFESFPDDFIGNMGVVIEYIRWKNPKAEIHIVSPPYQSSGETDPASENYGTGRALKITPLLTDLCAYYSCHFIKGTSESGIGYKGMNSTTGVYTYDGTHFNALGNEVFGKYLAQKLIHFS